MSFSKILRSINAVIPGLSRNLNKNPIDSKKSPSGNFSDPVTSTG